MYWQKVYVASDDNSRLFICWDVFLYALDEFILGLQLMLQGHHEMDAHFVWGEMGWLVIEVEIWCYDLLMCLFLIWNDN